MKKTIFNKTLLLIVALYSLTTLLLYRDLFEVFYQQDEWMGVGQAYIEGYFSFLNRFSILGLLSGKGRILAMFPHYAFLYYFPFNMAPFAVFALFFHAANAVLVYLISKKMTKNTFVGIISGLFFAISFTHEQAITWAGASTTTLPAAFLVFLSIYLYLQFLEVNAKRFLLLSFLSGMIAFYFKESSIYLFFLLPLLYFIFNKKNRSFVPFFKIHLPIIIFGVVMVLTRIADLAFGSSNSAGKFTTSSTDAFTSIFTHVILYPLTSISQLYIPADVLFGLARKFEKIQYGSLSETNYSQLIAETVIADFFSVILSLVILGISVLVYLQNKYRKSTLVAIFLIVLSVLPFAIIDRGNAYLESRYYYTASLGASLFLGIVIKSCWDLRFRGRNQFRIFLLIAIVFSTYHFLKVHIQHIQHRVNAQVAIASERREILNQLSVYRKDLPNRPVFYVTSSQSYYIAEQPLPFQQGIGYTFMVWYLSTGKIENSFVSDNFLWNMGEQGYKDKGGRGFGYYWDYEVLAEEIKNERIEPEQVVALYYDGASKRLKNNSDQIRGELGTQSLNSEE